MPIIAAIALLDLAISYISELSGGRILIIVKNRFIHQFT
jgi:hypothetical protein